MKKLSLVLLLWLYACCLVFGEGSSSRMGLFNEALGTVGKRVPSGWIENDGSYWKSRDIAIGKEFTMANANRNIVVNAQVGCAFANVRTQIIWLKESYDMLIADKWELVIDDGESWVLMKGDKFAIGVTDVTDGTPMASVVFQQRN
jgi:hypothetical protein